jgi:hypothetical protein
MKTEPKPKYIIELSEEEYKKLIEIFDYTKEFLVGRAKKVEE